MAKTVRNIITIGASAGGLSAVSKLLAKLPTELDAAVFIVIHLGKAAIVDVVINMLSKNSALKISVPEDGTPINNRQIYLAPADSHMMLEKGKILIKQGAKENHWRPSIDVLFRTAAAAYGSCVTGIILTGLLDDGTSGMAAIKKCGGRCIVQEPGDAEFPDMPNNVLSNMDVDYRVQIEEMGYILGDLYSRNDCDTGNVPDDVKLESEITLRMTTSLPGAAQLGTLTPFTCPDCGGVLTQIDEPTTETRFRCFTGHVFSESFLDNQYAEKTEETLWVAIRMMEERRNFNNTMRKNGVNEVERAERDQETLAHIERLKTIMQQVAKSRQELTKSDHKK
jgi:two-component system, chemotaxis family, protein-glutamate methylesterase/glutaminase